MGKVLWLTGLPCSGKSTIAEAYVKRTGALHLDGDTTRSSHISRNTGFSSIARKRHLLRIAEIARIYATKGDVVCSFISPSSRMRNHIAEVIGDNFMEIYVSTPVEICEKRDVKGMYALARQRKIKNFTGISGRYDVPVNPILSLDADKLTVDECVNALLELTTENKKPASLFIGRWNGVFHNGHMAIINEELTKGNNVLLAIRDVKPDDKNPWTAYEVKDMLDYLFEDKPVETTIIPDIASVNYGRDVGYGVNEIVVPTDIQNISGTACRQLIVENNMQDLSLLVPQRVTEYLDKKYS